MSKYMKRRKYYVPKKEYIRLYHEAKEGDRLPKGDFKTVIEDDEDSIKKR